MDQTTETPNTSPFKLLIKQLPAMLDKKSRRRVVCRRAHEKWAEENPEKLLEAKRDGKRRNEKRVRAALYKWREENRERYNAYQRQLRSKGMKLYKVVFQDSEEGVCLMWFSSKREADKALCELQDEARKMNRHPHGPECVDEVDVPTRKKELLQWLNSNFNRDNG